MKLITWNCRVGGFRGKAKHMERLQPDVLAVQEVEPIDKVVLFGGDNQPTYSNRLGDPLYPRRAIGMFSYTDMKLKAVDGDDPMYWFRRFEARHGDLMFQVVAVWTWGTKVKKTSYRQAHDGLLRYADWIRQRPTVILGDFNANASFKGGNWRDLVDLTKKCGLVSAYHEYSGEPFGKESRPTHFHRGKEASPFHLDYCFVPDAWKKRIRAVEVGRYGDWHTISDHAPLIVDLNI